MEEVHETKESGYMC